MLAGGEGSLMTMQMQRILIQAYEQDCRDKNDTLTVASLEPLTKRLAGRAACAGSQAMAVIHFVCPTHARNFLNFQANE